MWFKVFLFLLLATPSWAGLPPTRILDEGTDKGVAFNFDCVGAGIVCSQSGVTGTLTVGGGGSGDSVSIDGVAVTDPNFASTGDVDFVDTANVVTGTVVSVRPAAENSIEALLDLQDLQGAVTDAQVPNTITVDLATTATTANAGDSATAFFAAGTLEEGLLPDSATVTGWVLGTSTASSLASPIFSSNNADPADAGIVRLGNAESIAWEAAPAGTDITLIVDASEIMQVSGALNAVGTITGSNLSGTNTGDNTVATSGDSATSFFASGTIEHERGGLEADVSAYDGLIGITGGATYNQTGTTTQIVIFDGAGAPTSAALSGDVTMSNGGVVTIGADKITEAMLKAVDAAVDEECLTKEDTTGDFEWQACGGGGAPTDADYLVGTANGSLSAEIVVGTTPGGELGGTWGTPTLDDSVSVSSWNLTTPTFTTSITATNLIVDAHLATTESINLPVYSAKLTGAFVVRTPTSGDASTQGAQIDAGDGNWRLLFDATTDEAAVWQFRLPDYWAAHGEVNIAYTMTSATALEVEFEVDVMCVSDGDAVDVGTASFAGVAVGSATVPGTIGYPDEISVTVTDDSCAAGDMMWVYLSTDANDATADDATGDREVIGVEYEFTR